MDSKIKNIYNYLCDMGYTDITNQFQSILSNLQKCEPLLSDLKEEEIIRMMFNSTNKAKATASTSGNNQTGSYAVNNNSVRTGKNVDMNKWQKMIYDLMNANQNVCNASVEENPNLMTFDKLTLDETDSISVPNKMDLYTGLDITEMDQLYVQLNRSEYFKDVLFVNGEGNAIGKFLLKVIQIDGERKCILTAAAEDLRFDNHSSTKYYFVFCNTSMKTYKVPIEVAYQRTEITNTHLCIDFGTSNTTVGCFLDDHYVNNISNIAMINGNVLLNSANITKFVDKRMDRSKDKIDTLLYESMVPTIVYVNDCSDPQAVKYSFGYEAARKIKDDNYCPKASCFMEIKRWTSNIESFEDVQDAEGNKATVSRKEIISEYLLFVIKTSENQFKCKFKNVHISAPVKLKDKVLKLYSSILEKHGYIVEQEHAIDEGIAVLYSIINNQIKDNNYENDAEEKALIIDCGGGTSDLASCRYKINKDEDGIINLDIVTEYMNGDANFGGNNLTYRIMQFMKIVYAEQYSKTQRTNIDNLINQDINSMFSYMEGELENDSDEKVKERYEEVYKILNQRYMNAENIIPTRFKEYENKPKEIYDKVKNNFYFLWKLAEEMKKEFYRSTSISRYSFNKDTGSNKDIDLHINRIENWRLSIVQEDGTLKEQIYPDITFTAKEIDKLIRADIYYLVRKFLNNLYMDKALDSYSQIKLSGQSSKINIFMESLKEFLPGKKIKSGRTHSRKNDAEELKLLCLKGAIMYLHALEKSNIEVNLKNDTRNIPISVFIKNENNEDKEMFKQGSDWNQVAKRRRITTAGKEVYLYMRNSDKEIGEPYKYVYENMQYKETKFNEIKWLSENRIMQEDIDKLSANKKYIYVFLNKAKWGFDILPVYRDENGKLYKGKIEFCSFEMDILQETFFDGRR